MIGTRIFSLVANVTILVYFGLGTNLQSFTRGPRKKLGACLTSHRWVKWLFFSSRTHSFEEKNDSTWRWLLIKIFAAGIIIFSMTGERQIKSLFFQRSMHFDVECVWQQAYIKLAWKKGIFSSSLSRPMLKVGRQTADRLDEASRWANIFWTRAKEKGFE